MKRFYCTICKRTKRVRKLPVNVHPIGETIDGTPASYSDGTCDTHNSGASRAQQQSRIRRVWGLGSTRKIGASAARSKSKKG